MGDPVSSTIKLIKACVTMYTDFCAFQEECTAFRRSLCHVVEVLESVEKEISEEEVSRGNTRLRRPMELLQAAATEGGEVLRKCSCKRKVLAFVFSRQQMGMLNKAKADIEEAMRLLQVSSVRIQVSTRRVMDGVSERLDELNRHINDSYTSKHEVADMIRREMQQRRNSHGARTAVALSDILVKMGVVSSPQDCTDQIVELQKEAESIRKAKVIYDEEILEAVKVLTAPPEEDAGPNPAETPIATQEYVVCPISGDIMHDPVTVMESGLTYDRKSLCSSLLLYPNLEPGTGQRFDGPLHYAPNLAIRNLLMAKYGDSYYQKYDDTEFQVKYKDKWEELCLQSVLAGKDKSGESGGSSHFLSFQAGGVLPAATTSTKIHGIGSSESGCDNGNLGGFNASDFGAFNPFSASDTGGTRGGGDAERKAKVADDHSPEVKFGDSEEPGRDDTFTSDPDDLSEAANPGAATKLDKLRACCRSRRFRWLAAGGVAVVVIITVAAVVLASKSAPPVPIEEKFRSALPP